MVDFSSLLNRAAGEAKKPVPLPDGDFPGVITKWEPGETRSEKKTPKVTFTIQFTGWPDDVSASDFPDVDLSKRPAQKDFWLTEESLFRLDEFLTQLGIDLTGRTYQETLPEAIGKPVIATMRQKLKTDNSGDIFTVCEGLKAQV